MSVKAERMRSLVDKRRREVWPGYTRIADYHDGIYEAEHVCPYSKSACNLDARIMVMLQDWISHDALSAPVDEDMVLHGQLPHLPTNRNLKRLLLQTFGLSLGETFATDLFPFIKPGGMSSYIPTRDLRRAAREYGLPQIEIVSPELVVCIGLATFNAVRSACGLDVVRPLGAAIDHPFRWKETHVWCQAHTGGMGYNMRSRGDPTRVAADWARMRDAVGWAPPQQRRATAALPPRQGIDPAVSPSPVVKSSQ